MVNLIFLIFLMLICAKILAFLCQRLSIPAILGELGTGVMLGPSLLNIVRTNELFSFLAEIGVILLLFEVGLHTDISRLFATGRKPFVVALMGFVLPIIFGFALARYFGLANLSALFIGGTLSATSIGITMRVLADLQKQHRHEAQIVLGAAIVDDIFGVLLLSVLYNFAVHGMVNIVAIGRLSLLMLAFLWLAPLVAKVIFWGLARFLPAKVFKGALLILTLLLILLLSILAHLIGAPSIIGGFVAGVALSRQFAWQFKSGAHLRLLRWFNAVLSSENTYFVHLEKQIMPLVQIFAPIFFVMVGVSLNFRELHGVSTNFWCLSLGLLMLAFLSKFLAGFFIKEPRKLQMLIGVAMIPRGEVGLIFASLGLSAGILTPELYACLILVVALTTFLPPFLLKWLYKDTNLCN